MNGAAAEGFLLGLGMGGTCVATCAPFILPLLVAGSRDGWMAKARVFGEFLAGRLVAYLLMGAAAFGAGQVLEGILSPRISALLQALAAAGLLAFSMRALVGGRECPGAGRGCVARGFTFATGLVLGLNLCPPFAVALLKAAQSANLAAASVYFIALFLGTTVFLLPVLFAGTWMTSGFFRRVGAYFGILAGAWFLIEGVLRWH